MLTSKAAPAPAPAHAHAHAFARTAVEAEAEAEQAERSRYQSQTHHENPLTSVVTRAAVCGRLLGEQIVIFLFTLNLKFTNANTTFTPTYLSLLVLVNTFFTFILLTYTTQLVMSYAPQLQVENLDFLTLDY